MKYELSIITAQNKPVPKAVDEDFEPLLDAARRILQSDDKVDAVLIRKME